MITKPECTPEAISAAVEACFETAKADPAGALEAARDIRNTVHTFVEFRSDRDQVTKWLNDVVDILDVNATAAKPDKVTIAWIKSRCARLRHRSLRECRNYYDWKFMRSRGAEVVIFASNGDYRYTTGPGGWDGTLSMLKSLAKECRENGGDTVQIVGGHDGADNFEFEDYEPLIDCDWFLDFTVEELIGK
jgi:hypothetical protein